MRVNRDEAVQDESRSEFTIMEERWIERLEKCLDAKPHTLWIAIGPEMATPPEMYVCRLSKDRILKRRRVM